jgi:hypothetical protein
VNTVIGLQTTQNVNNFLAKRGPSSFSRRILLPDITLTNLTLGRYMFGILAVLPYPLFP